MSITGEYDYDYIIIGSGFGGSVSALRLAEKGYRVLVLEKGKRLTEKDFPATNWNLKRWFWLPALRCFGFFRISLFKHITILSGAGVGGGSLVYANCLQVPKSEFFTAESWGRLANWEQELKEHYDRALNMLGAVPNPRFEAGDRALRTLGEQIGKADRLEPTRVGVFFGEPEVTVPDPYFNGTGPARAGCNFCGGCMVGCRYNAKNTLDKNYLYFAERRGVEIRAESEVYDVLPLGTPDGSNGYRIKWRSSTSLFTKKGEHSCRGIVFAGGVLGTVNLLLTMRRSSLPNLSAMAGANIRTNSEALVGVTTFNKDTVFSDGIAIGSILQSDDHSCLEPVRYPANSGFWRMLVVSPMVHGKNVLIRIARALSDLMRHPFKNLKVYFVRDWAKRTQVIMLMRTLDSTLRFRKGLFGMRSSKEKEKSPTAFIPEARDLADRYAAIVNGKPMVLITETLLGNPTTAHIFGGAVMGKDREEGVIDSDNRVFGYEHMYICDGSMISANLGVNPSLTITALSERAMTKIPPKSVTGSSTPGEGRVMKEHVLLGHKIVSVTNRDQWRSWLEKNHAKTKAIWLVFYKKKTGKPSIPYADAVEESLCFGWIDSIVKKVDEDRYIQKFTPRRRNSTWSALNKKRARKMIKQGRMTDAGREKIEEAKNDGSWRTLDNVEKLKTISPELTKALSAHKEARKNFNNLAPTSKKQFLWWIESAKKEETRKKRIAMTVRLVSRRKTLSDH